MSARTVGTPLELGDQFRFSASRAQQFRTCFCTANHVGQVIAGEIDRRDGDQFFEVAADLGHEGFDPGFQFVSFGVGYLQ
ncbi:MAG: hypothetical protein V9G09_01520 [Candidatus Nanopelagicales bacterium]